MEGLEGSNSVASLSYLKDKQLFNTTRMELQILNLFYSFLDLFLIRTLTCLGICLFLGGAESGHSINFPFPDGKAVR